MKINIILLTLALCVLCGCGGQNDKEVSTTQESTGYPGGEVQRQYVMVDGTLYVYDDNGTVDALPAGYAENGTIEKISNSEIPDENYEASQMETGLTIYVKEGEALIYVGDEEQGYQCFKVQE